MNGILLIDKAAGVTSHDVVDMIKKKLKARKVGHTGTLDPFATGLMILCIGTATRLARFLGKEDKIYRGQIILGITTDTYDMEGKIISTSSVKDLTLSKIQEKARNLTGKIKQVPPPFSAKRVEGTRSYLLARQGRMVALKPIEVFIHYFMILSLNKNTINFETKVSSGTYVRSIANDLGKILGCGATLKKLKRLSSGGFHIRKALKASTMADITVLELKKKIIPLSKVPLNMHVARIQEAGRKLFSMGNAVPETYFIDKKRFPEKAEIKVTTKQGEFLGIGIISKLSSKKACSITIKPKIVFA